MGSMTDALIKAGFVDKQDLEPEQSEIYATDIHVLDKATKDSPIYLRATITDEKYDYESDQTINEVYYSGLVACVGTKDVLVEEDKYNVYTEHQATLMIIDPAAVNKEGKSLFASTVAVSSDSLHIDEQLQTTDELSKGYQNALNHIEWTITANRYGDVPKDVVKREETIQKLGKSLENTVQDEHTGNIQKEIHALGYDNYCALANMKIIDSVTYHVKDPSVSSFDDLERYMIENHPSDVLYYGASSNTGDWSSVPTPASYQVDIIKNRASREAYVRSRAEKLGCSVGEFEYPEDKIAKATPKMHRGEDVFDIPDSADVSAECDGPKF